MFPSLDASPAQGKPKKLLDEVRDLMRLRHYSVRTERCYCDWIKRALPAPPQITSGGQILSLLGTTILAERGTIGEGLSVKGPSACFAKSA